MRKLLILLFAASAPAPALAQHEGHAPPPAPATEKPKAAEAAADPHAGHLMPAADPQGGRAMPPAPPPGAADPHAGHEMGAIGEEAPAPPLAPPPPGALAGPDHAADSVYGREAMAQAREGLRQEHGSIETYKVMLDRFEARIGKGPDRYLVEGEAWYGGDIDKLWVKAEIEGEFGRGPEQAQVQALWSRAVSPWFNLQGGLRYDFRPDPQRAHLVLGIEGLAPYWFEIDAAAFLSHKGEVTARFEAEYDQRLTRKLILQPRIEFDLAAQDVAEIGIGSGLSSAEFGLRLRYEIQPEFAPYVGIAYERAFGDTADLRRAAGDRTGGWNLLLGVRAWF